MKVMTDKKSGKQVKNYHEGHRIRMKKRYIEQGIDGMADHEVLELLLFYALPYRDTNGLAHELLHRFGSLSNVLESDISVLQTVNGIGPNAALLLNFVPALAGRYYRDRWQERLSLNNGDEILDYVRTLFIGRSLETFFMICLNSKGELKNTIKLAEGTSGEVVIYTPQVVEKALQQKCKYVIFAHNHPGGNANPSRSDVETTNSCLEALRLVGITVLDHVIVSGDSIASMAKKHLIQRK